MEEHPHHRLVWNRMAWLGNRAAMAFVVTLGVLMIGLIVWTVGGQVMHYVTDEIWLPGSFGDAFGLDVAALLAGIDTFWVREMLLILGTEMHIAVPCGILFLFCGTMHFLLADSVRRIQLRWAQLNFDMTLPHGMRTRAYRTF